MDMQEILRNVITSTNEIFQAEAGSVALLEPNGREIVIRAAVGAGADAVRGLRLPSNKGIIGWVATQEKPALVPDVTKDDRFYGDIDKDSGFSTQSIMCVPMRASGKVIGVIELMNMRADYLSDGGLKILGVIADHAALAIENARLLARTRQQAEEQAIVFGTMAIVTSDLALDTVLEAVSRQMVEALNADLCIICRWNSLSNELQAIQYFSKIGLQRPAQLNLKTPPNSPLLNALNSQRPTSINTKNVAATPEQKARLKNLGVEQLLSIPLVYRRQTIGIVEIGHRTYKLLTADELNLGQTMAVQAAVAIEHARLYNEATRRLAEAKVLQEVMVAAASTLEFEQILSRTIKALHRTMGIERLGFFLPYNDTELEAHPAMIGFTTDKSKLRVPTENSAVGWVSKKGQPLLIADVDQAEHYFEISSDTRSELVVPVKLDGEVVAVLNAESPRLNAFDEEDLRLFNAIAAELAVALKNAKLFQKEHWLVGQQQALLDIFTVLSTELQPQKLFQRIIERAIEFIPNAEAGTLIVKKPDGNFGFAATVGFDLKRLQKIVLTGDSFAEASAYPHKFGLEQPRLKVDQLSQEDLLAFSRKHHTGFFDRFIEVGRLDQIKSTLRAVLVVGDELLGSLCVDSLSKTDAFTNEDEKILLLFANQAAVVIQNVRLFEEIRAAEANYRDLFDNANDLIFILDSNFRVSSANKETLKITGHELNELIGMPVHHFINPSQTDFLFEMLKQHLTRTNLSSTFELSLKDKAGQEKLLEVTMRIKRSGRRATELHFIARNITQRRELERQLQQTEKLSSIGKLVAGVAHELNNPLTSIIGYTSLLKKSSLSLEHQVDLQIIAKQAERARIIVRDLLTFARNIRLEDKPVDLNGLVQTSVTLLKPQLQQNNIHLTTTFDFGLPKICADPHRLEQVFINLITNSIQALAGRPQKKTINISSCHQNGFASISITDNGPGISPEVLNHIFDPFFSTKQVGAGTGLGLSICFGIISAHNGRIWAENKPDGGTVFNIQLPIPAKPLPAPKTNLPKPQSQLPTSVDAASVRILVVDDEIYLLNLIKRVLKSSRYSVETANNGAEAFKKISALPFDIIICDVLMPGVSGIELYRQVTTTYPSMFNKFLFITGNVVDP